MDRRPIAMTGFDPYIGRTRVERATAFENALKTLGISARLLVIPGTGHECNAEMQNAAIKFLREADLNAGD